MYPGPVKQEEWIMKPAHEKYIPFVPIRMEHRSWPDKQLKAPPSGVLWICGMAIRPLSTR